MSATERCQQCDTPVSTATGGVCVRCATRLSHGQDSSNEPAPATFDLRGRARQDNDTYGGPTRPDAFVPVAFGNYDLLDELGRGGMGVVYKARQKRADRIVALKVIQGGGDRAATARFTAEARALARISHPHIVAVYDVDEENGCPFFTMEFVDGPPLSRWMRQGDPPTAVDAARFAEDLAGALQAAHSAGVLHRDVKPSNVLIGPDRRAKLTDFGLAKHLDRDDGVTMAGSILGTASYMPPEVAAGKAAKPDPTVDVYSLGATLYELLTGRPPFRGDTPAETLMLVVLNEVTPPRWLRPGLSRELEAICLKCLEKNPEQRYATAAELADDLARWRTGRSTVARPLSRPAKVWRRLRRNRRAILAAAVVLLAVALAAVGGAKWVGRTPVPPAPPTDPWAEIGAALRRGEKVVLLGPRGEPGKFQWIGGVGDAAAAPNSPFEVSAKGEALLELVPDTQTDRYRLTAEFQARSSSQPSSYAGIYFGHREGIPNDAGTAARVGIVRYRDDLYRDATADDGDAEQSLELQYSCFRRVDEVPFCCLHGLLDSRFIKEDRRQLPRPWRKVELDVTPEGIAARWRMPDGTVVPIGRNLCPRRAIDRQVEAQRTELLKKSPGLDLSRFGYDPRGGVGLYVASANVYFRNVVLEPLVLTPNP